MKKSLSLFFFLTIVSSVSLAQNKTKFGVQGGLNFASQTVTPSYYEVKPIYSLHLTGLLDIPLTKHLYLQPGLSLQGKGRKTNTGDYADGIASSTLNMMYLEIPVTALWKFPVSKFGKLMAGGGPYAAVGLAGQETYTGGSQREHVFNSNLGSNGYSPADFGVNFQLGAELNSGFTFHIQEGWGLANVAPEPYRAYPGNENLEKGVIKHRASSLSVGYLF